MGGGGGGGGGGEAPGGGGGGGGGGSSPISPSHYELRGTRKNDVLFLFSSCRA